MRMNAIKWILPVILLTLPAGAEETSPFAPKFFAFENGLGFGSDADAAKVLKELGYAGMSQAHKGGARLQAQIDAYGKEGLEILSVYLNVRDQPIEEEVVKPLANRNAMIELTTGKITPELVKAVRETAAMAAKLNIKVVLYPHHGNGVEKMSQAMDLIAKVDHPNLGVMFNVCHYLKNEKLEDMEAAIEKAGDRLFAVSVNGATVGGKNWGELIRPLGQGDFPLDRLLKVLKKVNFSGPVGLQCYAVKGDKRANLKTSMEAWKKALAELQ